ncbi:MAG: GNAT family N-acetyltransferase [Dehalococcoidia bacterium]|nr:GNAT family N-acetyltransferase [Dehalococcoidia bacterium]
MIRKLSGKDAPAIYHIINQAAVAYKSAIPADCYHEPYMPEKELRHEMKNMTFFGWEEAANLVGVIGYQPVKDMTLIRHAYVLPDYQRTGIGTRLLDHIRQMSKTKCLLVGTWADATWAINFYQKHGFKLLTDKDKLLNIYWDIPQRQAETSVVLGINI